MASLTTVKEEASIVIIGNFNPRIFHPEWFIAKNLVPLWNYQQDPSFVCLPDLSTMDLGDGKKLQVYLNQYVLKAHLASEYPTIRDITAGVFSALSETPMTQMGMNYTTWIKFNDDSEWLEFGKKIAPHSNWTDCVDYFSSLSPEKQRVIGLAEITMQIPRNDDFAGVIKATISGADLANRVVLFRINNHVDFVGAGKMREILESSWDGALEFARKFTTTFVERNTTKD